jgi:phage terminase small subunit
MRDENGLMPKQARFVEEYLIDLNATQAAIRAGYSAKTARQIGEQNLKKPDISRAIEKALAARSARTRLTQDWVLEQLEETLRRCLQRKPVMAWSKEKKRMVQTTNEEGEGVWTFDSQGANRAAELIGKHLGMFRDAVDLNLKGDLAERLSKAWERAKQQPPDS